MWQILCSVILIYFLAVILGLFQTFDNLVRLEYENHRTMWEKDGKPNGFSWRAPKHPESFRTSLARSWLFNPGYDQVSNRWLFVTPHWMRHDEEALRLVHRYRSLAVLLFTSLIVLIIVIAVAIARSQPGSP